LAEGVDYGVGLTCGDFYEGRSIQDVDDADRLAGEAGFVGDRANDIAWPQAVFGGPCR